MNTTWHREDAERYVREALTPTYEEEFDIDSIVDDLEGQLDSYDFSVLDDEDYDGDVDFWQTVQDCAARAETHRRDVLN